MEKSYSESYAAAGVDITAGYKSVELMKQYVARTMNEHCIGGLGGFGGLFELDCTGYKHPVLISGTDGVGTKLKLAMILDKHDTIGIDCVAMCVNDVICAGAKPLVFLDYIACGRNVPEKIAEIVKGVAEGCVQADCSLVGGETAEHPGMMPEDEYDLAGFSVGVVDKDKIPLYLLKTIGSILGRELTAVVKIKLVGIYHDEPALILMERHDVMRTMKRLELMLHALCGTHIIHTTY